MIKGSALQAAVMRAFNVSILRGFRHAKELRRKGRHTLYLGGMLTSIWIWSGQVSASIISTPLYSHSFLRMLPISVRICPYIACLRYFGAKTMCYLQFQRARLSISSFFCVPNMDIPPLLLFLRSANLLRLQHWRFIFSLS